MLQKFAMSFILHKHCYSCSLLLVALSAVASTDDRCYETMMRKTENSVNQEKIGEGTENCALTQLQDRWGKCIKGLFNPILVRLADSKTYKLAI